MATLAWDARVPGRQYKAIKLTGQTLGASGTHTSDPVAIVDYAVLRGLILSDQNSATNGFKLEEGIIDGNSNFKSLRSTTASVTAGTASAVEVNLLGEAIRISYVNGGTAANDFNMWLLLIPRDLAGV